MSKPVYTVQVDSRFRDLEKYPNTTDFGVSFKKRISTTPFVEGLPVNNEANGTNGTNFNLPVSIDPDFDNDLFQIVNGKITNMKAIDANNVVLCGIFTGEELSFYQKDLNSIYNSPSYLIVSLPNNNNSTFLVKFSRIENAWTFNWVIVSKQPDGYIALDDPEINCSFDIDTNNSNISFMFNFSSPKIYIQSLTSLSVQNDNQYFTIYEANHPDNLTKTETYPYALNNCLIYSLFDYNGNVKYVDNHPWGYNIISSNHNIIPSEINCKFNIKLDNSLAQVVSANTNNYEAVLALTGYGTGFTTSIFPNDNAYGITYTYTGLNYVVNLISDPTTNETNIITQQYTGGVLTQTKFQCLTGLTTSVTGGNNFVNVCYLEKNNKIYFHISPYNAFLSNTTGSYFPYIPASPYYQSYIYTYDIPTQNTSYTTTGAGDFSGSRLGFPGGEMFDTKWINPSNLTGAYIIGANTSVYGLTGSKMEIFYWDETINPPTKINSYDFSPSRKSIVSLTGFTFTFPFGPVGGWDFYGIGYYSSIQQDGTDVYYVCSPAPLSTGTMTGDGLLFDNITSLYKINSLSITGTQILNTFETQSYFWPELYIQNSDLNLISAAPDSQILNINKATLEVTQKSKFIGGNFGIFIKEYNNNLYAIYNSYFTNKVFQINDPVNPLLISGKQQFPVFGKYEIGKLLFIDDQGWCYGFSINQNTDIASFFSSPFLTQPAQIKSSHYNQNISSVLNPINYYGQNVSTYGIDYYNEPAESLIENSFSFNPLEQLVNPSGASILYAWYDASKTGSIIVSNTGVDNFIVQVNDLSNNNRNLTPQTGGITPGDLIYKYGYSINFNGGQQLEYTGDFSGNQTGVYIAVAYKNTTGSASVYNIAGFYEYPTNNEKFYIKSFYDGTQTYTQNFAGSGFLDSFTFDNEIVNQPILNLADFMYYNTGIGGSVYDVSFRGTPSQFIGNEINIRFTGAYFKLGDNLDFKGEIFEVIVTSSLPSISQRQKIISYLGKKWNMNNNVPFNNPYKQYSPETLYSTLLTKASTGTSNVDIYNISNLQNIVKVYSQETTITDPTYIKVHILKDLNNTFPVSKWFLVLGKSSLEIYTNFITSETNSFYLWNRVDFSSPFSNEAWKIIPYTQYTGNGQFAILYFLVLFKNGYVKKYRISILTPYNLEELVTEQFMLPPNGYLTSGEINIYGDGKIYFFGTIGVTDVNLSELSLLQYKGKLYFADITNPYDFIKIESNINFALSNIALTNRNSTKVIKHPNGNTYLYLRSIFIDSTQFINISDYTLFTYNNYNKIEIVNSNAFSFQTPINISTQLSYEDGNFGCFCPADIYINPSNNNVISIQTQNNNLTNDLVTPQDQQFYLGFTNCNFITNDPEGVVPIYPFGTRVTQLKAGSLGNKVYAGMLLTDITNSFAATGVYFVDISNPEFSYTFYQDQSGAFPLPLTTTYQDREGISIGFINKCDYEGKSEWLNSIGGSYTGIFSQFSNMSNMTLDNEKRYIYLCGGWNSKVECFDSNNEVSNRIVSEGTSYNGFCTKIDIIDGSFKWLTPLIGNNDDFTEKISFNSVKDDFSFLMNFSSNNLFLYEPQYSFTGSSGTYSNPKIIKTVLFNTSSLTSSIITLDTEGNYKWKVILYTNEDAKTISAKDIYIDDETINIVGTNNTSIMRCTQSDNTDVQLLYNQTTNTSLFIYRFDLEGNYLQSNLIKYPNGINLFINDIKTFKTINQIVIFPYIEIEDLTKNLKDTSILKYNKDGTLATENSIYKLLYVDANSLLFTNTGNNWNEDPDSNNDSRTYFPSSIKDFRNEIILKFQQFNDKIYIARRDFSINFGFSNAQLYAYSGDNKNYLVNDIYGPNDIPVIPITQVEVNVMENIDDKLYIGGNMSRVTSADFTDVDVNYVYYIDNTETINSLNIGLNGFVYSIKKHSGDIYIGGNFTGDYDNLVPANNIIKFDGTDWFSLDNGLNGVVRTLESDGVNLFAGGDFTGSNSTILNHVARWDGSSWNPMATGLNGRVNSLFYKNGSLYAGGEFTGTNLGTTGTVLNYISRWDGTGWNDMNYGLSNTVNVICDYSGNDIAVGGDFTSSFTGLNLNYSTVWSGTGWNNISSTGLTNPVTCMIYTGSTLYTFQTNPITTNNKYTQINFYKYNSSYVDLNGNTYSNLVMSYSDFETYYQSPNAPSGTNALTNYNAYIQGSTVSDTSDEKYKDFYTKLINTKQTIILPNDVLNRNYSIRGNFFTGNSNFFSGLTNETFNIVLNSEVDIKKIDRNNFPFAYYILGEDKWASVITKSPVGDIIAYEQTGPVQYIQDGILPITVTNIYGQPLNTYANPTQTQTPYYLYYYDMSSTGNIGYTLVNSVIYNSSQKIYYMTLDIDDYISLPNDTVYLWLSKKNLSAEYTLQFYPATLNSSKVFNLSLNNLIIPNRPIRNTTLEGTRLLTDLPYIYLSVFNADDNGLWYGQTGPFFGGQEINNFFSNNVSRDANAIFEIPMKYAVEKENFVVLSSNTKPRIKFNPNYYNIRYILTDPDGNVLLFDNTPYKSIDNFTVVPDSLLQTNISVNFEPLTN